MTLCMEAWLLADLTSLTLYFGKDFNPNSLPKNPQTTSPADLDHALKAATKNTTKGQYSKGSHSFDLLAAINPATLEQNSPSALTFLTWLRTL